MKPVITAFFDPGTCTVSYIASDPDTRHAVVIDPVLDFDPKSARTSTASAEKLIAAVREKDLTVDWILETHAHADHLSAAQMLKAELGGQIAIGEFITMVQRAFQPVFHATDLACDGKPFDYLLQDGDTIPAGNLLVNVLYTPGHTPACVSYKIGSNIFVGDTLFMPDYGTARCDFPGGDPRMLYRSIRRILSFPSETTLWMCHDYGAAGRPEYAWQTTVAEQRAHNIHIHDGVDEESFVAMRSSRDKTLAMPLLILPAVQVNIRAGQFPPPESDGRVYLKLPVNIL